MELGTTFSGPTLFTQVRYPWNVRVFQPAQAFAGNDRHDCGRVAAKFHYAQSQY